LNGDGVDEALVGVQSSGRVYCLDANGEGTAVPPISEAVCENTGEGVLVSWSFDVGAGITGFNVYRGETGQQRSPAQFRSMLADRGIDTVPEMLAARAGAGERGGLVRLNDDLVSSPSYLDGTAAHGVRYVYVVGAVGRDGSEVFARPVEVLADLSVSGAWLAPVTPNPFRTTATVEFSAPAGTDVRITIHDCAGRLVAQLFRGPSVEGTTRLSWDGRNEAGLDVASGVYLVRAEVGDAAASRKVVLMR
jgi:hypothetical protein